VKVVVSGKLCKIYKFKTANFTISSELTCFSFFEFFFLLNIKKKRYNSVLRGDQSSITLGTNSTVQERAVISSTSPTVIGNNCVIGVGAQLSGCTLKDNTLVGVGASVESGAIIEQGAVVAAGSVVGSNVTIPAGQLWSGNPVAYLRDLTAAESDALAA